MSRHAKHEDRERWLRDVYSRQRNVIFPDVVENEARFWRNLWRGGQSLTLAQLVGLFLLLLMFGGLPVAVVVGMWRETQGVWWQKVIFLYGGWLAVILVPAIILVAYARYDRRRRVPRASMRRGGATKDTRDNHP